MDTKIQNILGHQIKHMWKNSLVNLANHWAYTMKLYT